ncbi:hypothetical protein GCM10010441_06190 [Kitasatospora paracochleata]
MQDEEFEGGVLRHPTSAAEGTPAEVRPGFPETVSVGQQVESDRRLRAGRPHPIAITCGSGGVSAGG